MKKLLKITIYLALFLLLILLTGVIYQNVATSSDNKNYPFPGRLISMNGKKIHVLITGKSNMKKPTIILVGGLGGTSSAWKFIQSDLEQFTQVVSYDRPGYGWSDIVNTKRDGVSIAKELHETLKSANVSGPYILVGHSFGGLYTRIFASLYPNEIKGLVLLESSHPDQFDRTKAGEIEFQNISKMLAVAPWLARIGFMRFKNLVQLPNGFPEKEKSEITAIAASTNYWEAQKDEFKAIATTNSEVNQSTIAGTIPLLVIIGGDHIRNDMQWRKYQKELANLSKDAKTVIIEKADHTSIWSDKIAAQSVSKAIIEFYTKSFTHF